MMRFLSVPAGIRRVNESGDWLKVVMLYSHWLLEGNDAAVFSLVV